MLQATIAWKKKIQRQGIRFLSLAEVATHGFGVLKKKLKKKNKTLQEREKFKGGWKGIGLEMESGSWGEQLSALGSQGSVAWVPAL